MLITRIVRNLLSDPKDDYTFRRLNSPCATMRQNSGLYIHVPFCQQTCPYCPYLKYPYSKEAVLKYAETLIAEIKLRREYIGRRASVSSVYFGGGSPMLLDNKLAVIINTLNACFSIDGPLAIEANPLDVSVRSIQEIKHVGFDMISLGVQSFSTPILANIGRNYDGPEAKKKLQIIVSAGFKTVNVDLMFVLPGQNDQALIEDIKTAITCNPTQITCYPLFTFPYTQVNAFKKKQHVIMPNHKTRKRQYYLLYDALLSNGFNRETVWSFSKNNKIKYSSVTRDYFLGIGPGSGSYDGNHYSFNTFNLDDWYKIISDDNIPEILGMDITPRMAKLFWLYWQIYATKVSRSSYKEIFNTSIDDDFAVLLKLMRWLRMTENATPDTISLSRRGAHWIHVLQNYFALNYINKIWGTCQATPRPETVSL